MSRLAVIRKINKFVAYPSMLPPILIGVMAAYAISLLRSKGTAPTASDDTARLKSEVAQLEAKKKKLIFALREMASFMEKEVKQHSGKLKQEMENQQHKLNAEAEEHISSLAQQKADMETSLTTLAAEIAVLKDEIRELKVAKESQQQGMNAEQQTAINEMEQEMQTKKLLLEGAISKERSTLELACEELKKEIEKLEASKHNIMATLGEAKEETKEQQRLAQEQIGRVEGFQNSTLEDMRKDVQEQRQKKLAELDLELKEDMQKQRQQRLAELDAEIRTKKEEALRQIVNWTNKETERLNSSMQAQFTKETKELDEQK